MWVFTRYGFFSIACANGKDGEIDENTVMIRARSREHLENLRERFSDTHIAAAQILSDKGTDYKFRVIIPKAEWALIISQLATEQTWSNFKNEASRFARAKHTSNRYINALHDIWRVMADFQFENQ